jgi:hypothetical protein
LRNISYKKNNYLRKDDYKKSKIEAFQLEDGLSKFDFMWIDPRDGTQSEMQFNAGFIGTTQNNTNKAIRPEIGWLVIEKNPKQ